MKNTQSVPVLPPPPVNPSADEVFSKQPVDGGIPDKDERFKREAVRRLFFVGPAFSVDRFIKEGSAYSKEWEAEIRNNLGIIKNENGQHK